MHKTGGISLSILQKIVRDLICLVLIKYSSQAPSTIIINNCQSSRMKIGLFVIVALAYNVHIVQSRESSIRRKYVINRDKNDEGVELVRLRNKQNVNGAIKGKRNLQSLGKGYSKGGKSGKGKGSHMPSDPPASPFAFDLSDCASYSITW